MTPANDNAPVITSPDNFSLAENITEVGKVIATDADLPALALSYRITGGPDAGRFALDLSSGVLRFLGAPDFEKPADADKNNVYVVEVTADENDGSTATPPTNRTAQQTINVTVTDVPADRLEDDARQRDRGHVAGGVGRHRRDVHDGREHQPGRGRLEDLGRRDPGSVVLRE